MNTQILQLMSYFTSYKIKVVFGVTKIQISTYSSASVKKLSLKPRVRFSNPYAMGLFRFKSPIFAQFSNPGSNLDLTPAYLTFLGLTQIWPRGFSLKHYGIF